jgi:hypothetical protein
MIHFLALAGAWVTVPFLSAADRNAKSDPLAPTEKLERLFSEIDMNKDGTISLSEFKNAPFVREAKRSEVEDVFHTVDANINGSLDKAELAKGIGKIRGVLRNSRAIMDDGDSKSARRKLRRLFNR